MKNVIEMKRSVREDETRQRPASLTCTEMPRENRSADSRYHERDQYQNVVRRGDSNSEQAKREVENLPAEKVLRYRERIREWKARRPVEDARVRREKSVASPLENSGDEKSVVRKNRRAE